MTQLAEEGPTSSSDGHLDVLTRLASETSALRHRVPPGVTWVLGRSVRADVRVPNNPHVSLVALVLRNRIVSTKGIRRSAITIIVLQRGSARIRVESESGDLIQLASGAPELALRQGDHYLVALLTPGLVAEVEFTTPALSLRDALPTVGHGTETWTAATRGISPAWVDVAAMAVLIFHHPDVIPVHPNGKPVAHSDAFTLAVEIFTGHASNDFRKRNLELALHKAGIETAPGQDRLGRVAQVYGSLFDAQKINDLANQLREPLYDLWEANRRYRGSS